MGDRKMRTSLLSGVQGALLVFVFILRTWASEARGIYTTASFLAISPPWMGSLSPGPPCHDGSLDLGSTTRPIASSSP